MVPFLLLACPIVGFIVARVARAKGSSSTETTALGAVAAAGLVFLFFLGAKLHTDMTMRGGEKWAFQSAAVIFGGIVCVPIGAVLGLVGAAIGNEKNSPPNDKRSKSPNETPPNSE